MVSKKVRKIIDATIKDVWLSEIRDDYIDGKLIREASLQCSLYHHLRNRLESVLEESNLYIYPEFVFRDLHYRADLVIAEMDMDKEEKYLADCIKDVVAVIELKYTDGVSKQAIDYVMSDINKFKNYINNLSCDFQAYFGVIYEEECSWLYWADKRRTNTWANGRLTELNAGYIDDEIRFEVNSHNGMNLKLNKRV